MNKATALLLFILASCFAWAGCDEPKVAAPSEPPEAIEVPEVKGPVVVTDKDGWETTVDPTDPEPVVEIVKAFPPEPPGFPVKDQYESHAEACFEIVRKEVPSDKGGWQRAILDWCNQRSFGASRYQVIVSKIDGSGIHGRDRPTAWMFYERSVLRGRLDPENCPFHKINRKEKHPPLCVKMRRNWPYKDVNLSKHRQREWKEHPHDMERFGARGPHDWNANAFGIIPGCWDPAQLDRFDVNITTTVRASLKICKKHGCGTKYDIKAHWGRGKRKKKQPRPDDERPIEAG